MGGIKNRLASREDVKKLSGHIREKLASGSPLSDAEKAAAGLLGIDIGKKICYHIRGVIQMLKNCFILSRTYSF